MNLDGCRILITGASGGIGRAIAVALAARGARLALSGQDRNRLLATESAARAAGAEVVIRVGADLRVPAEVAGLVDAVTTGLGGIDAVVLAAGQNLFRSCEDHDESAIEAMIDINLLAPLLVTRQVLPAMKARGSGAIVVLGSIFGSIGYPYFSVYSATKFALRGFCESLRRELDGSGVSVLYVAPRATDTAMTAAMANMVEQTGMKLDAPDKVARQVVAALERGGAERFLGFPERLFVRLNSLAPRLMDKAMFKEAAKLRPLLQPAAPPTTAPDPAPARSRPSVAEVAE